MILRLFLAETTRDWMVRSRGWTTDSAFGRHGFQQFPNQLRSGGAWRKDILWPSSTKTLAHVPWSRQIRLKTAITGTTQYSLDHWVVWLFFSCQWRMEDFVSSNPSKQNDYRMLLQDRSTRMNRNPPTDTTLLVVFITAIIKKYFIAQVIWGNLNPRLPARPQWLL